MMNHLLVLRGVNCEEPDELNLVEVEFFFDRLVNWYPPLSRLDSIKLSGMKTMDFLGPKEC